MGSVDFPFNPVSLALGAEATFVARTIDSDRKHLTAVLRAATEHRGTSLVEIYQNCNIFNDDAFEVLKAPETRDDFLIRLEHGQPITFGTDADRAACADRRPAALEVCDGNDPGVLVHDAHDDDPSLAFALSRITRPDLSMTPIGVFRDVQRPVYDDLMAAQLDQAVAKNGAGDLAALLAGGDTWTIAPALTS